MSTINGAQDILINLKICAVNRLKYSPDYKIKEVHYVIELKDEDNETEGTIILAESELNSSRMLDSIFEKYEMAFPNFRPYFTKALSKESVIKAVRGIILDYAQQNALIQVAYHGGWMPSGDYFPRYYRPLNTYYRKLAVEQYPAISRVFLPAIRHMQLMTLGGKTYCGQLIAQFSCIQDNDVRIFFFLFWHYCYMSVLFLGHQQRDNLSIEITDLPLRQAFMNAFFGSVYTGSCEIEGNTTTRKIFNQKFEDAKDIPFLVVERATAGRNTMRKKISDLQDILVERSMSQYASAVPVIFPTKPLEYQGLLHLTLDIDDFSGDIFSFPVQDCYPYFAEFSNYLNIAFWNDTLYKNLTRYNSKGKPTIYAIFETLYSILKDYYPKVGLEMETSFESLKNENVESFLDRYLPRISSVENMKCETFLEVTQNLLAQGKIQSFQRLGEDDAACVPEQILEEYPCVLIDNERWAFNSVAFDLILSHIPNAPSRRTALKLLHEMGILCQARTNRDSYRDKLTVHIRGGGTSVPALIVLQAQYFESPKNRAVMEFQPDHRYFLLGKEKNSDTQLYLDFDSTEKSNRHMLITGKSGTGKSYLLQTLLRQAAEEHITTVVFHSQGELPDIPNSRVIDVDQGKPSISLTAEEKQDPRMMASLLKQAFRLRDSQYQTVYICYQKYLNSTSFPSLVGFFKMFEQIAKEAELKNYSSVQSRLYSIIESKAFSADPINWQEYAGETLILDFRGCSNYMNLFQVQAELFLHDLYHHRIYSGPDDPLIAVVDEFQKLNTNDGSMLVTILREGRKYGWSLWLASQLAESGQGREIKKLAAQASAQLYFSQGSQGNRRIANILGLTTKQKNLLFTELQALKVGEFLIQEDGGEIRKCIGER